MDSARKPPKTAIGVLSRTLNGSDQLSYCAARIRKTKRSETAKIVEEVGCGVVVPPGRPELLAAAIRRAYDGELDLAAMGERGRAYVAAEADRSVAVERYRVLLREVLA